MPFINPEDKGIKFSSVPEGSDGLVDCSFLSEEDRCVGFSVSAASTGNDIWGGANGTITLTVTGGATPYTYSWSNGSTDKDLTGLSADTYTVTVTDANGCAVSVSVAVAELATQPQSSPSQRVHFSAMFMGGLKTTIIKSAQGPSEPTRAINLPLIGSEERNWYQGGIETWWKANTHQDGSETGADYDHSAEYIVDNSALNIENSQSGNWHGSEIDDFIEEGSYPNISLALPNSIMQQDYSGPILKSFYVPEGTRLRMYYDPNYQNLGLDVVGPVLAYAWLSAQDNPDNGKLIPFHSRLTTSQVVNPYTDGLGLNYNNCIVLYNIFGRNISFLGVPFIGDGSMKVDYDHAPVSHVLPAGTQSLSSWMDTYVSLGFGSGEEAYRAWSEDSSWHLIYLLFAGQIWKEWRHLP
jgi:hypothetical protein